MVLVYHSVQMAPVRLPTAWMLARHGRFGVDLFFVLSGWLIGSLFWSEFDRGVFRLWPFWLRRWWRTIPAYLVALLLSWLAVHLARGEPFDWTYLCFVQNYREQLPFFLVSWSLAVEEHCYLLLPILLLGSAHVGISPNPVLLGLAVISLACRAISADNAITADFGFYVTATHFRWDGIVLGFWASRLHRLSPDVWQRSLRQLRWALPILIAAFVLVEGSTARLRHTLAGTLVALTFLSILMLGVGRVRSIPMKAIVELVSVTSYSIYLIHALTIRAARAVASRVDALENLTYFVTLIALTAAASGLFYRIVERPSLSLRKRFAPKPVTPKIDPAPIAVPSGTRLQQPGTSR